MITQPDIFRTAVVFCECCGRPLSDPASVQRGIGPICAEKAGHEAVKAWVVGWAVDHDSEILST